MFVHIIEGRSAPSKWSNYLDDFLLLFYLEGKRDIDSDRGHLATSFAPLSMVTFKAGELEAQIAGISMPVATALWTGVVLIILGFAAIVLSRR